jgi:hypothetical protein
MEIPGNEIKMYPSWQVFYHMPIRLSGITSNSRWNSVSFLLKMMLKASMEPDAQQHY